MHRDTTSVEHDPLIPAAVAAPEHDAELPIWVQAVSDRTEARRAELFHSRTRLRNKPGVVGALARFTFYDTPPATDCQLVSYAVQDVQMALLNPNDQSGLSQALPGMAARARAHAYAQQFQERARATERRLMPALGVPSAVIPLLHEANRRLRRRGTPDYAVEEAARYERPLMLSRALARVTLRDTRDLLFTTVFGPEAS